MPKTTTKNRKYATLGQTFLKGTIRGQINSVHRTRETLLDKVADFKAAIAAKDIRIHGSQLSPASRQKLLELGIELKA